MGYRQPRVPVMTAGENLSQYVREIAAFLRENAMAAWNADRLRGRADPRDRKAA